MGLIFDTTVLVSLERKKAEIEALVKGREDEPFGISAVTAAELIHGIYRADSEPRRLIRQAFVEKILAIFPAFCFDIPAARIYARIWASMALKGDCIGAHDLMIASTAISLGYALLTSNVRDFQKIDGLVLEIWAD
jgi:tRNA(fMet)-specific endonuclease VapC